MKIEFLTKAVGTITGLNISHDPLEVQGEMHHLAGYPILINGQRSVAFVVKTKIDPMEPTSFEAKEFIDMIASYMGAGTLDRWLSAHKKHKSDEN